MIVLDANVAVKWYIPERGTEAALEIMTGQTRLLAPELIRLEVLGAITRRVRKGEALADEAQVQCGRWLNNLRDGTVSLIPEADLLQDALALSLKIRHPIFDCLYLAAAMQIQANLVTADRPFHDKVMPVYANVSLLPGIEPH